jgi:zinc protease
VQIAYLAPECRSADFAPLTVLDAVLSGAKPIGGGGAQTNRSARLYKALVQSGLASSAGSGYGASRDPYLFSLRATVQASHSAEEVERALLAEVERVQREGISAAELERVRRQVRAQIAYGLEGISGQARRLGMWEVLESYTRAESSLADLAAVTAEDVQRVALHYLTERRRTVGHFVPTEDH